MQETKQNELEQKRDRELMNLLRATLTVLVVFIHTIPAALVSINGSLSGENIYHIITELISHNIGRMAVPGFYIISGYFMFHRISGWGDLNYRANAKKKLRTLVIPYLLWNVLYVFLIWSKTTLFERAGLPVYDYERGILQESWLHHLLAPINYPLWYLKDLIALNIIFPLFYLIFRYLKLWGISLLFIYYLLTVNQSTDLFSSTAIFYFGLGAYFSLSKCSMLSICQRYRYAALMLFIPLILLALMYNQSITGEYLTRMYIPLGLISLFNLTHWLSCRASWFVSMCTKMLPATFFIYALHTMYLINWVGAAMGKLGCNEGLWQLIPYFLTPTVTLALCWLIYLTAKKLTPRLLSVLTGGRS